MKNILKNTLKELTEEELDAYSRQIVLTDIGYEGQLKLKNSKVAIVGLGGLGSISSIKLAAMGVGYLRIIDRDVVSRSDLHRQHLYDLSLVGYPKAEAAYKRLKLLNPNVTIEPIANSLNTLNAIKLVEGVDVVIDGLDTIETRYLLNRVCQRLKIPYIFGSAIEAFGNVSTIIPGETPCLECFYHGLKDEVLPKCGTVGVHPSVLGIIANIQVSEAIRLLIGQKPHLLNKLLYVDIRSMAFDQIIVNKRAKCPVCELKIASFSQDIEEKYFEETCARDGKRIFIVTPKESIEVNLNKLIKKLSQKKYKIKVKGNLGLSFVDEKEVMISILKSGIAIFQVPPRLPYKILGKDIIKIYETLLVEYLGLSKTIVPSI